MASVYGVCLECHEVYDMALLNGGDRLQQSHKAGTSFRELTCPRVNCNAKTGWSKVVAVDEFLIEPVIILNRKGYRTAGTCASHLWSSTLFLFLQPGITLPEEHPLPDGLLHSVEKHDQEKVVIYGSPPEGLDKRERLKWIFSQITALLEWAEGLPALSVEENFNEANLQG